LEYLPLKYRGPEPPTECVYKHVADDDTAIANDEDKLGTALAELNQYSAEDEGKILRDR
jgi:hypothetical protein